MANSVIGQVLSIGPTLNLTSKSGSAFTKRSIVISVRRFDPNTGEPTNDYENTPEFSFIGDKCRDLDQFAVGQNVEIFFDINGRKYVDASGVEKIITDVRPYRINPYGQQRQSAQPATQPQPAAQTYAQPVSQQGYTAQQGYAPQPMNGQPQTPTDSAGNPLMF